MQTSLKILNSTGRVPVIVTALANKSRRRPPVRLCLRIRDDVGPQDTIDLCFERGVAGFIFSVATLAEPTRSGGSMPPGARSPPPSVPSHRSTVRGSGRKTGQAQP